MIKYQIMGKEVKKGLNGLLQSIEAVKTVVETMVSPVAGDMLIDYLTQKMDQLRRKDGGEESEEVSNPGRGANKSKGELTMCTNEETKKRVRQRLDGVLLAVKVAQTVEGHRDPDGGDAVVEVLMEELMKLHSCYGKKHVGCCDNRDEILRCAQDDDGRCGDTCGCPDGDGCACQDEESCPCPGATEEMCDCGRKYDLPFGCALEEAKNGARIARKGWNGKNQYVFLAKDLEFHTDADLSEFEEHGVFVHDALAIKTSADQIQIGWLASQSDMLSNDWYIVE